MRVAKLGAGLGLWVLSNDSQRPDAPRLHYQDLHEDPRCRPGRRCSATRPAGVRCHPRAEVADRVGRRSTTTSLDIYPASVAELDQTIATHFGGLLA